MMSSQKTWSFGRLLTIGSAALLIQAGAVAAANQRPDIQQQMQQVLSGAVGDRAARNVKSGRDEPSRSAADIQAFARRLLQGWSASVGGVARPAQRAHGVAADSGKHMDVQAMVRRQLLGA